MTVITKKQAGMGAALVAMLVLAACVMTPGKFTSSLDIRADRSFTFTYQGEVIVTNFDDMPSGSDASDAEETDGIEEGAVDAAAGTSTDAAADAVADAATGAEAAAEVEAEEDPNAPESEDKIAKMEEIAANLAKEDGYRSVKYLGKNKFEIDYRITGKLDHGFVFPFNPDAQAIFPFLSIQVRKDGRVKVEAPGFAENSESKSALGSGAGKGSDERNGTFTVTTNAEIVSQNQEDGAKTVPNGKQLQWKVTPTTSTAPMVILQLAPKK